MDGMRDGILDGGVGLGVDNELMFMNDL